MRRAPAPAHPSVRAIWCARRRRPHARPCHRPCARRELDGPAPSFWCACGGNRRAAHSVGAAHMAYGLWCAVR
eukprot:5500787-Prymnesium_polylepis.1